MIGREMLRPGLIWRGQKRGDTPHWALRPRLDRDLPPPTPDPTDEWGTREARYRSQLLLRYAVRLRRFKAAAAGRRGVNPRNLDGPRGEESENDEWWALGQHYGLDTPLLDWTESPFAALFFAFLEDSSAEQKEDPPGKHCRYVFALDRSAIERWNETRLALLERSLKYNPIRVPRVPGDRESERQAEEKEEQERRDRVNFPKIRIIHPTTDENLRLLSQGGVFTQAPPGKDIETFVRETFKETIQGAQVRKQTEIAPPWMMKFMIREGSQQDCLVALDRMAINHRTLFPDLTGASLYVNNLIEDPTPAQ